MTWEEIVEEIGESDLLPEDLDWGSTTLWGILDWLQSMLIEGLMGIFNFFYGVIETLADVTSYIPNADAIFNGIADIASLILIIIFLKQIFTNYILDIDGDSDADPIQALINIAVALAVINCAGEIHDILMKVCNLSVDYLTGLMGDSITDLEVSTGELIMHFFTMVIEGFLIIYPATGPVILLIVSVWIIVVAILMVVLAFKILFRGAELFIFQCLFPLFACDLITPNKELWKPFLKSYLVTIFGYLVQYLCLMLSIHILFEKTSFSSTLNGLLAPLIGTVLLFFACKAPKWLQHFTYQSGAGQTAASGAKGVMGATGQIVSTVASIK